MSVAPEVWDRILECGALAPSGDNLQPWIVDRTGDALHLSVDPARDRSLYNRQYRASLIALGAMIENVTIAGRQFRLATEVELSAPGGNAVPSAALTFRPADVQPDPLFPSIARRCTNRKPYRTTPVAPEVLGALKRAIPANGTAELRIIEDAGEKRLIARAASLNDRLLFEIKPLHDQFFEAIRWTEKEAVETGDGLFVKTLELGPTAPGFKAMRSWNLVRVTNRFGASVVAPFHSFRTFLRSPAFGFLQMADASLAGFIEGGRLLQRVWLTATSMGLSFQPMAGMLYLLAYLRAEEGAPFGSRERSLLVEAENLFKRVLPLDDNRAAIMLFRVGYSSPPSATSLRRPRAKSSVLLGRDQ